MDYANSVKLPAIVLGLGSMGGSILAGLRSPDGIPVDQSRCDQFELRPRFTDATDVRDPVENTSKC